MTQDRKQRGVTLTIHDDGPQKAILADYFDNLWAEGWRSPANPRIPVWRFRRAIAVLAEIMGQEPRVEHLTHGHLRRMRLLLTARGLHHSTVSLHVACLTSITHEAYRAGILRHGPCRERLLGWSISREARS